ncbi:hypothetical protein PZA11_007015 [Diplocarpon coronariae]
MDVTNEHDIEVRNANRAFPSQAFILALRPGVAIIRIIQRHLILPALKKRKKRKKMYTEIRTICFQFIAREATRQTPEEAPRVKGFRNNACSCPLDPCGDLSSPDERVSRVRALVLGCSGARSISDHSTGTELPRRQSLPQYVSTHGSRNRAGQRLDVCADARAGGAPHPKWCGGPGFSPVQEYLVSALSLSYGHCRCVVSKNSLQ